MASKLFQKRVDVDLLERVSEIYDSLGTSVGDAFVMFLKKSEECKGLPFELRQPVYHDDSEEYISDEEVESAKLWLRKYVKNATARRLDVNSKEDMAFLFDEEW